MIGRRHRSCSYKLVASSVRFSCSFSHIIYTHTIIYFDALYAILVYTIYILVCVVLRWRILHVYIDNHRKQVTLWVGLRLYVCKLRTAMARETSSFMNEDLPLLKVENDCPPLRRNIAKSQTDLRDGPSVPIETGFLSDDTLPSARNRNMERQRMALTPSDRFSSSRKYGTTLTQVRYYTHWCLTLRVSLLEAR